MSTQGTFKTNMCDRELLIGSIKEIYGENSVEIVAEGVKVKGYNSAKRPSILIKVTGLYGTAGFVQGEDGNYEFVYDSTDRRRLKLIMPEKKGAVTHHKLAQIYNRLKVTSQLVKQVKGKIVQNMVDEQGRIRLRIKTVAYEE